MGRQSTQVAGAGCSTVDLERSRTATGAASAARVGLLGSVIQGILGHGAKDGAMYGGTVIIIIILCKTMDWNG